MPDCHTCAYLARFEPRLGEPSGMGCKHPTWGGCYVTDPTRPLCSGTRGPLGYVEHSRVGAFDPPLHQVDVRPEVSDGR